MRASNGPVRRRARDVTFGGRSLAETRPRQLIGLDLIRFGAAFAVMLFHLCTGTALAPYTRWGWVGVEVFFVLSGFVIAYTAAASSAGRFLRNRVVRLMPAVWICGSATALMWIVCGGEPDLARRYLNTLILWPIGPWVDPVYWTLPVEIVFYALVFAMLAFGAFRWIEIVAAVLAAASTGYLCVALAGQRLHFGFLSVSEGVGRLTLIYYGCYFALGVALWLTFFDRMTPTRTVIGGVAALGGAIQIIFACRAFSATEPIIVPELAWLTAVALMALSAWQTERISRLAAPIGPWARRLGLATYPLYLLHDDLGNALRVRLAPAVDPTACALFVVPFCIAAALVVAVWIEPPIQSALRTALAWMPRRAAKAVTP